MITGELKSKIEAAWNGFCSGGVSNPPVMIEDISELEDLEADISRGLSDLKAILET